MHAATVAFALALGLVACKAQSTRTSGDVASCNVPSAGNCREYGANNLAAGSAQLAKLCGIATTATFAMTACPTTNSTGRCASKEHTDVYYASYPIPADDLQKACTASGGEFTRSP